jgi:CubicO group peptidase (beta-lactamase class C family)
VTRATSPAPPASLATARDDVDAAELPALLDRAVARVRAPDVVVAVSVDGRRTYATGGTGAATAATTATATAAAVAAPAPAPDRAAADPNLAPNPAPARDRLGFALGSLTKTFTVLLLADLARAGRLALDDPMAAYLPGSALPRGDARRITLRHLATHTAGLPRVPRDMVAGALLHPYANGYASYDRERLLAALARTRLRHSPGARWHYSNLGLALLGPVLERAAGAAFPDLLAARVLRPLGLEATALTAGPGGRRGDDRERQAPAAFPAATGYRADGRTPLPATEMAAFAPAGGLVGTPGDLLGYAEAHLRAAGGPHARARTAARTAAGARALPPTLAQALGDVQVPQLRRGSGHREETHTLTWYRHPAAGGPLLFHAGATFGQQCFLGFHPPTRTAVAAFATRHDRTSAVVGSGYELLRLLAGRRGPGDGT